jgi:transcriptional regulator with XRE-family HTH domain
MSPAELRAARQALGLTQKGLAERLGVSKDTLNRWEKGRQTVHFPTILRLALERLALPA